MKKRAYSEQLKDPRWQKKRLEQLERFKWTCSHCYGTEETLHVHHQYYVSGRAPWEYPDCCYLVLCKTCHEAQRGEVQDFERPIAALYSPLIPCHAREYAEGITENKRDSGVDESIAAALADPISGFAILVHIKEQCDAWYEFEQLRHDASFGGTTPTLSDLRALWARAENLAREKGGAN